jgi:hypothetical protein
LCIETLFNIWHCILQSKTNIVLVIRNIIFEFNTFLTLVENVGNCHIGIQQY